MQIQPRLESTREVKNKITSKSHQRSGIPRSAFQRSNGPSRPPATPCVTCSQGVGDNGQQISSDKDNDRVDAFDKENDFSDDEGAINDDEEVKIDDGV